MIELTGLSKRYVIDSGSVAALNQVSLKIEAGERLGLFGPSGSGKTTLLRCIAGLESPEEGVIRINGEEVFNAASGLNLAPWVRPIGMVFQDYALWPHMRVLENVMFPLKHGRTRPSSTADQRQWALEMLDKVHLGEFGDRFPAELSGGQRQRVALARALVCRPSVLLMDEPLSSLDPHLRRQTRNELVEILDRAEITTIFVSHDHVDGLFLTSLVGIMRGGKMLQVGPPLDVFMSPADPSVAQALDVGALLRCYRTDCDSSGTYYQLRDSNQSLRLPHRAASSCPEEDSFMLVPAGSCRLLSPFGNDGCLQQLEGEVLKEGYTGRGWCVLVKVGSATLELWSRERSGVQPGENVRLTIDVERVQILSEANV